MKICGDFVFVGVYVDVEVRARRGVEYSVLNEKERALSVLVCRYVDEVVIGVLVMIMNDLLIMFNVKVVIVEDDESYVVGGVDVNAFVVERGLYERVFC